MLCVSLQRYRIGPNFRFVEVNRPRCPVHSSAQNGPLNIANQTGEINYFPSQFSNQVRHSATLRRTPFRGRPPTCMCADSIRQQAREHLG